MYLEIIKMMTQIIIPLGIFNVWILRFSKATKWRGTDAKNMKEEFASYGLSLNFMYFVGFLKILLATLIFIGIWYPSLTRPAAIGLSLLMIGAVGMHLKVHDSIKKFLPSSLLLLLCLFLAYLS